MERERDGHGRIGRSVGRSVGRRAISRPITHLVRRRALRPMGYIVRASVGQRGNKLWADQGSRLLLSGPSSSGDGGGSVTITTRRSFRWFGTEPMYYLYYCLPVLSLSFLSLLPSPSPPPKRACYPFISRASCVRACPEREKHADDGRAGARSVHVKIKKTTPQRTRPLPTP